MKTDVVGRYLDRYAEPAARWADAVQGAWDHVLVVPVRHESPAFLEGLVSVARNAGVLVIVVLNECRGVPIPAHDKLRRVLVEAAEPIGGTGWVGVRDGAAVLTIDATHRGEPLPVGEGVGLARKIGADLAVALWACGRVRSPWVHFSDADAAQCTDRFTSPVPADAMACVFPFRHVSSGDLLVDRATVLYEIYLRYHVLGLRFAGSPYAFHTIGSAMAVRVDAYAAVRGVPKRRAAEDFYLLTKVAKLGRVFCAQAGTVDIQARVSTRIPFGTGPAVARIVEQMKQQEPVRMPDPRVYGALREWIRREIDPREPRRPISDRAADALRQATQTGVLRAALDGAMRSATTDRARRDRSHEWFDGLRTLQLMHRLERHGLAPIPWTDAISTAPFVPGVVALDDLAAIRQHLVQLEATPLTERGHHDDR